MTLKDEAKVSNVYHVSVAIIEILFTVCQVLHQDIMSHQHVLDSLSERAQSLSQTAQPRVMSQLEALTDSYRSLCTASSDLLNTLEANVAEHQAHHDTSQDCDEKLCILGERITANNTTSGDRFAIQNKLESIQDTQGALREWDSNLRGIVESCNRTALNTSPPGQEALKRDLSALQSRHQSLTTDVADARSSLQKVLQKWQEFEDSHEALQHWLHRTEQRLKDVELKASMEEKQEQVSKIKVV